MVDACQFGRDDWADSTCDISFRDLRVGQTYLGQGTGTPLDKKGGIYRNGYKLEFDEKTVTFGAVDATVSADDGVLSLDADTGAVRFDRRAVRKFAVSCYCRSVCLRHRQQYRSVGCDYCRGFDQQGAGVLQRHQLDSGGQMTTDSILRSYYNVTSSSFVPFVNPTGAAQPAEARRRAMLSTPRHMTRQRRLYIEAGRSAARSAPGTPRRQPTILATCRWMAAISPRRHLPKIVNWNTFSGPHNLLRYSEDFTGSALG